MRRACIAGAAAAVLALSGCGGIKSGVVTAKVHEPEEQGVIYLPIQVGSVCSGAYNSQVCTPVMSIIPYYYVDGEDWVLKLKDGKKKGKVYVSKATFDKTQIGQQFGDPKLASAKDPSYSKKEKG